jgi:tetratricopeptide (TPR) repeat protein
MKLHGRRSRWWGAGAFAVAGVLCASVAAAHDGIEEQIAALTTQISTSPADPDLRLRRADLYRVGQRWAEALADLDDVARLDPAMEAPDLVRAQVFFDTGAWKRAVDAATRFLERKPGTPAALLLRARSRARLGMRASAVDDFTMALETRPLPDVYLERANVTAAAGPAGVQDALNGLDAGVARLGPIVTLELAAIDLELRQRRYDAALARLDRVSAQAARQESWLARRGDILEKAGRVPLARAAYREALTLAESRHASARPTRASQVLIDDLRARLTRLDSTSASTALSRTH